MKLLYTPILIILFFTTNLNAQISGNWQQNFEGMPINQSPIGDWLSTGSFSVLPAPHGLLYSTNVNGLSCNLNASHLSDSIFLPKTTGVLDYWTLPFIQFRICNWSAGIPTSTTMLGAGDTCFFSIYKYTGSVVTSKKIVEKIHSGNYASSLSFQQIFIPINGIGASDVFRIVIHITRGSIGDYWYDFDNVCFCANISSVKEIHGNQFLNVYPNPAKNEISFVLNESIKEISFTDAYGKQIDYKLFTKENTNHQLKFNSSLSSGIYFITIKTDKGILNSKFVKD